MCTIVVTAFFFKSTQIAGQWSLQVFQRVDFLLQTAGSKDHPQNCQSSRGNGNCNPYEIKPNQTKWNVILLWQAELLDAAAGVFIRFRLGGVRTQRGNSLGQE